MVYASEFQTLAQIAIGLAGFTGIITTLQDQSGKGNAAVRKARLGDLLLASLGVVFFALLPVLFQGLLATELAAWRLAQWLFVVYHGAIITAFMFAADLSQVTRLEWSVLPPAAVILIAQLATAMGYWSEAIETVYFAALIWFLFIAALAFCLLLLASDTATSVDP